MHRLSLLLTILAVLCAVLVEAGPVRRPPSRRPVRPTRPKPPVVVRPKPKKPVIVLPKPKHPVVIRPKPTVVARPKPPVVTRPTTPGTRPQATPRPTNAPSTTRPGSPPKSTPSTPPPSSPGNNHPATPPNHPPTSPNRSPTSPNHPPTSPNRPATPPPTAIEQASGCRAYTTCDTCAAHSNRRNVNVPNANGRGSRRISVSCAWLQTTAQDTGRCVTISTGVSHPQRSLSTTAQQCAALHTAVHNRHIQTAARRFWAAMRDHVYDGDEGGRDENGRHLASSWLMQYPDDQDRLSVDNRTHLGQSPRGKTLWMDTAAPGNLRGPWIKAQIETVCIFALEASIREHSGGRNTPESQRSETAADMRPMTGHNRYSVRSPFGGNICIDVFQTYSCFPSALRPTTRAPGERC